MKVDKLNDKWTLVTGAGSGIGQAICMEAARRGSNIILCDIDPDRIKQTQTLLKQYKVDVIASVVDITKNSQVRKFSKEVHSQIESVDILVNNAGVALAADILETSMQDWKYILGVNLMGVIHICDAFCPAMIARGRQAHVVNIASMEGFAALEGFGAYSTSKFAVVGYTESLRQELSSHKIGVSVVCPGVVRTALTADMRARGEYADGIAEKIHSEHEKSNFGPEKVARAVFQTVRFNVALRPVAPESWITYYSNRVSPGLTSFVLKQVAHRVLRK
jgi:NAD(P)-dependent dehydrogenase (short-subunit alcohol dehydrogenase family)